MTAAQLHGTIRFASEAASSPESVHVSSPSTQGSESVAKSSADIPSSQTTAFSGLNPGPGGGSGGIPTNPQPDIEDLRLEIPEPAARIRRYLLLCANTRSAAGRFPIALDRNLIRMRNLDVTTVGNDQTLMQLIRAQYDDMRRPLLAWPWLWGPAKVEYIKVGLPVIEIPMYAARVHC